VGHPEKSPGADGPAPETHKPSSASAWSDDGLFDSTSSGELRWYAEARLLLNEAREKVLPEARASAQRQAERQVESLARQQGLSEITAELVGLALGGMSPVNVDDTQ
jgi:hypothetical protein